jgi:transposase InsO family protein
MERRLDFVRLADQATVPFATLCASFGISRKTGYKWLKRYQAMGTAGLVDQSRRPHTTPRATPAAVVAQVAELVETHPAWGGRKLHAILAANGQTAPAPSTLTAIIRREDLRPPVQAATTPLTRFEAKDPNELWQLDFRGPRPLCHGQVRPLTLLDDHSRFALELQAVPDQTLATVQRVLSGCFERFGLPDALLTDNGPPWGSSRPDTRTQFEVWLWRYGVQVLHGRPYHPQTQGKVERLHKTIALEVFTGPRLGDVAAAQSAFDSWRDTYNHDRPHDALGLACPASRYARSARRWSAVPPPIEYAEDVIVRHVAPSGAIALEGRTIYVGEAFRGLPVGLISTATDGVFRLQFCAETLRTVDLSTGTSR